jgi:hypothetical protein
LSIRVTFLFLFLFLTRQPHFLFVFFLNSHSRVTVLALVP